MTETEQLIRAIGEAISEACGSERRVAIAYSGGLDSSIIATLANEVVSARCYTCALAGSFDAVNSPRFAEEGRFNHTLIEIKETALGGIIGRASRALNTDDPTRIAYSIPLLSVLETCSERTVLTGSGADELFGGYAKYARAADPGAMMLADLSKMLDEDRALEGLAMGLGKRYSSPFVADQVLAFSDSIPLESKIKDGERKIILRKAAASLGLRSSDRPKKAAQYSTGIMKEMRRQSRRSGSGLQEWIRRLSWDEGFGDRRPCQRD